MKTISNTIAILLMLVLLLGLGWLGYITIDFLIAQFGVVDPQTSAVLTIASVTVLLSSIIVAGAIKTLNVDGDRSIHPKKAALYMRFAEALEADEQELPQMLGDLKKHMMIWASDPVLKEFSSYYELVNSEGANSPEVKGQAQKVITAIRQDVNKDSTKAKPTDIEKLLNS